jgi:uncharacterized protein (DUF4415 family)
MRFKHTISCNPAIWRDGVMADRTRRTHDPRQAAEAAFKKVTAPPPPPLPKSPVIPNARELVSLRIDREVLSFFQEGGAGWQERINDVLKKAAGK